MVCDKYKGTMLVIVMGLGAAGATSCAQSPQLCPSQVTRIISLDGLRVAFGSFRIDREGTPSSRIIVSTIDGSERLEFPTKPWRFDQVLWMGNDKVLYQHRWCNALNILSIADGEVQSLAALGERVAVSPDACHYVFWQDGLRVAELGKKGSKKILSEVIRSSHAWSPDSREVAFGSGAYQANYPLTIVDVVTAKRTDIGVSGVGAAWSPCGRFLAYTTEVVKGGSWHHGVPVDGRIAVYDLAAKTATVVTPPGRYVEQSGEMVVEGYFQPAWSPDSQWIAYYRRITHGRLKITEEIWLSNRDGSERRKVLNSAPAFAWSLDSKALLCVDGDSFQKLDLFERFVAPGPSQPKPYGEFKVWGYVADASGQPLSGVAITVARGWGTLSVTRPVYTDDAGRYEILYAPGGYMLARDRVGLSCSHVNASKSGYVEKNSCRHGRLVMAYRRPEDDPRASGFVDIVYSGYPYRLDFVMVSADETDD